MAGVAKAHQVQYFQDFASCSFKFTSAALVNFTLSRPHSVFAVGGPLDSGKTTALQHIFLIDKDILLAD